MHSREHMHHCNDSAIDGVEKERVGGGGEERHKQKETTSRGKQSKVQTTQMLLVEYLLW